MGTGGEKSIEVLAALVVLFTFASVVECSFEWGAGCEGGNGNFSVNMSQVGGLVTIGAIPKNKWNVRIYLTATADVDVQIYDSEDVSKFSEGKAVVAWCADPKTCNLGALGSQEGAGYVYYKGMRVGYSGYGGTGGMPGKEWISVEGVSTTSLVMKAFAFEAGTAAVSYHFDREQSATCLGLQPFTGTFSMDVRKDSVVDVGIIPRGKKNLWVRLYAHADVDIQLYDTEDNSTFSEGKAIIGYCDTLNCNKGLLGNNDDGSEESTTYKGLKYDYSGYYGDGESHGNEYLRVVGKSNTELAMKAYGYAAGSAIVSYSYYEDYDQGGPVQPCVDFMYAVNRRDSKTDMFREIPDNVLIVRRDNGFQLLVSSPENSILAEEVTVTMRSWVGESYRFGLEDTGQEHYITVPPNSDYPASAYSVKTTQDGATRVAAHVTLAPDAPVGWNQISVRVRVTDTSANVVKEYLCNTTIVVLFNPYGRKDNIRQSMSNRQEYFLSEKGLIWQGLSDANTAHVWDFQQFDYNNLAISLDSIRRMKTEERGDSALVSRHLSYALGQDICYGKWGEGSYTTGRPGGGYTCSTNMPCFEPGHWTGTSELFQVHRKVGGDPVQYCQCFVYSGVMTTLGRALGIPTRPVTTFQSAHDTNADRSISKYYTVDTATGIFSPTSIPAGMGHDSIWSFHVWNEMYMRRPFLNEHLKCKSCADGWQAVDGTPQELSFGGDAGLPEHPAYMMGPASIKLIRKNMDPVCRNQSTKYGCFDSQFVIGETNANILIHTRGADSIAAASSYKPYPEDCGENCGFLTDPFGDEFATVGLQISTKKKGDISEACAKTINHDTPRDCTSDLDDITSKYKGKEPSGPGSPTVQRRLSQSQIRTNISRYNTSLGMYPAVSGPVVNEPGHPASSVALAIVWPQSQQNDLQSIACALTVTVRDYTSKVIAKVSHETVQGTNKCLFAKIERTAWRQHAAMYLDAQDGLTPMDPGERAYTLHFEVTASTPSNGIILLEERSKVICTPVVAGTTRRFIFCDDQRGMWRKPDSDGLSQSLLSHLTTKACTDAGVSTNLVNDGTCQESKNVDGCWDGGDCCTFSCYERNGGLIQQKSEGVWEFQHTCFELNDTLQCRDPVFASGNLTNDILGMFDFSRPQISDSFGENKTKTKDEDECIQVAEKVKHFVETHGSVCVELSALLCHNESFSRTRVTCAAEIAGLVPDSCGWKVPRCAPRTAQGCQCQKNWTHKTHSFTNHKCGNPFDSGYGYHDHSWCNIVQGSCTETLSGESGKIDAGSAWDNCGTLADTNTGKVIGPGENPLMSWSYDDMKEANPVNFAPLENVVNLKVVSVLPIGTTTTGPPEKGTVTASPDLSSDQDDLTLVYVAAVVIFIAIGASIVYRACYKDSQEKSVGNENGSMDPTLHGTQKMSVGIVVEDPKGPGKIKLTELTAV
jgi:hypothetical protein